MVLGSAKHRVGIVTYEMVRPDGKIPEVGKMQIAARGATLPRSKTDFSLHVVGTPLRASRWLSAWCSCDFPSRRPQAFLLVPSDRARTER
jgi:hypothetical protein